MAPPSTLIMGQLEAGLTTMPATEQQQQQAAGDGLSSGDFASLRLVKDDYSLDALVVNSVAKARGKPGLAQASIRGLSVRHAKNIVARVVGDGDHHFDDAEQASLSYEGAPLVLEPKVDPESHGSKRAVHDEVRASSLLVEMKVKGDSNGTGRVTPEEVKVCTPRTKKWMLRACCLQLHPDSPVVLCSVRARYRSADVALGRR